MSGHNRHDGVLIPWLTPMRAARGALRQTGVAPSFAIHLAGLIFFFVGILLLDAAFWGEGLLWELKQGLEGDTASTLLFTGIFFVVYECCFVILAWMTACWGAGVEPFNTSFGRSLSRWYQLTPWFAALIIGLILVIQGFEELDDWYWNTYDYGRYGNYYETNTEPLRLLTYDRFQLLLNIGRFGSLVIFNLIALWWILGTVMVHRHQPTWFASCCWPATCEDCGYALAGLTDEQTCPECGKTVGDSKHTERGQNAIPSLRMLGQALIEPSAVGKAMATRQPTKQPVRVLLWGLLFTVLCGPVFMVIMSIAIWLGDGYNPIDDFGDMIEFYILAGMTVGTYSAVVGSLVLLGAGSLAATIVRVMGKRDIMPAACFAACYSAALLPIWVLLQAGQLLILLPLGGHLEDAGRYDLTEFFPLLVMMLHAAMLVYIVMNVARITKAARYANV